MSEFLPPSIWPPAPGMVFWQALTLVVGALLGEGAYRWLRLPRIVGYSAAGMGIAAAGFGLAGARLSPESRLVVDLALGLLLFELGSRVSLRWLRNNPALLWTSVAESLVTFGAIFAVLLAFDFDRNLALAGAALTMSASGAVIARVAAELKSSGQITERMIVLSALNTLFAVLALKLVIGWMHLDQRGDWVQGFSQPLYAFGGSVLIAALLSLAVRWVLRRFDVRDENAVLLLLGLILLAIASARLMNLSTVLAPLLAGVMLKNTSERPCIWPRHFGTAGGALVLMMFIVLGLSWSVAVLTAGVLAALALLLVRAAAKGVIVVATARVTGIEVRQGLALALTLTPVSATTLVLLADLQASHPDLAGTLAPVALATIAIMAIPGPLFVQWGLRFAGEYRPPQAAATRERP